MFSRRESLFIRIALNVKIENGCWIWQGGHSGNGRGGGYPRMSLNSTTVAVHRVVANHFFGYIPKNRQIDHKCKNRLCVNPNHLEIVTHKENQRRRSKSNGN